MARKQGGNQVQMKIGQLLRFARVPTLAATAIPLMVGGALGLSEGKFDPLSWLDIFTVALLLQVATNALNEYGDYRHGIDRAPSPGFAGLIVSGETSARSILFVAATCYAGAFVLGMTLVLTRGILMLLFGVVAILAGILYSEGPFPLSSTPVGELLVAVVMGPVEVVSANLAASGEISTLALIFSIPVSLMTLFLSTVASMPSGKGKSMGWEYPSVNSTIFPLSSAR